MNNREKEALDRHITGNYGEDQFPSDEELEMTEQQEKEVAEAEREMYAQRYEGRVNELIEALKHVKTQIRESDSAFSDALISFEEHFTALADEVLGRDCFDL